MSDLICYCFGYSGEDIEQDYLNNVVITEINLENNYKNGDLRLKH